MARGDSFLGGCLGGLFGIFVVSGICVALCAGALVAIGNATKEINEKAAAKGKPSPFAPSSAAPADDGLTMAKFRRVQTGMTKVQVAEILGNDCELLSENEFGGIKTQLYQYSGFFLASAHITFQNGRVVQKAQFGLK